MSNDYDLTILMPCLNEAETIGNCIDAAQSWINSSTYKVEILIADNGSTDGSQDIATSKGARVVQVPSRGYGSALYHGSCDARGKWIIIGDSDMSYDFSKLDLFVEKLSNDYDLVMGNRFLGGIEEGAMPWKNKFIGNPILSWIGKILFKCPVGDFHCGLRAYSKHAFVKMDLRTTGMEFASEMVIKANVFKMKIAEVPTTLSKDGRSRPPHLNPWRDGWRHLRFMILFSPRWLFLYPGLFVLCLSFFASLFIIFKGHYNNISFGVNSLIFSAVFAILGYLLILNSVVVRMIAVIDGVMPDSRYIKKIRDSSVLEIGTMAGLLTTVSGLLVMYTQLNEWSKNSFGLIHDDRFTIITVLSGFGILFGIVTIVYSLTIGFLSLPSRRN